MTTKDTRATEAPSPSSATPVGTHLVRLPDTVDVLLTACSKADKPAVIDRIHRVCPMAKDEIASMVDEVVRAGPLMGVATLPIEDARALVRDLDALGVDAVIELTAASLQEPQEEPSLAEEILAAVEAQRILLLNVHSTVRCLKFSEETAGGELQGALELVEMELLRISSALEEPQLRQPAAEGAAS